MFIPNKVATFVNKLFNNMNISYYKMTGDELKRIYKVSELKSEEFAAKLGIVKHQLYTQFSRANKSIDADVETALKANPELAKHQQNLAVGQNNLSDQGNSNGGPSMELWQRTIELINETVRLLADDNKFIKKDAEIYRDLVEQGIKNGAISFNKTTTKKV